MTCDNMISATSTSSTADPTTTLPSSKNTLGFDNKGGRTATTTNANYLTTKILLEVSFDDSKTKSSSTGNHDVAANAMNILDEALDCLDTSYTSRTSSSLNSSFNNSFIDEIQIPVKYDDDNNATTTTSKYVVPEKVELLLDDMRAFEDMVKNATIPDVISCCSDYEEEDEDSSSSYDDDEDDEDDVCVPVKFDAPESSSKRCNSKSPRQKELMLDNMKSFESMLDLYRKNPPPGDFLDDLSDEEDEEEEDEDDDDDCCCYY